MSRSHTLEPWFLSGQYRIMGPSEESGYGPESVARVRAKQEYRHAEVDAANAARIVACVNACRGMIDPEQEIRALRQRAEGAL